MYEYICRIVYAYMHVLAHQDSTLKQSRDYSMAQVHPKQ